MEHITCCSPSHGAYHLLQPQPPTCIMHSSRVLLLNLSLLVSAYLHTCSGGGGGTEQPQIRHWLPAGMPPACIQFFLNGWFHRELTIRGRCGQAAAQNELSSLGVDKLGDDAAVAVQLRAVGAQLQHQLVDVACGGSRGGTRHV